jgi:hypothetical protein
VQRNGNDEIRFLDCRIIQPTDQFLAKHYAAGHVGRKFEAADQLVDRKAVRQAGDGLAPRGRIRDAWPAGLLLRVG